MTTKTEIDVALDVQPTMSEKQKIVRAIVSATIAETGIKSADSSVLDSLIQLFELFISELCYRAKEYCEHAGRTLPIPADLIMSYAELGRDIYDVPDFANRSNPIIIQEPGVQSSQVLPKILQTGDRKSHPSYIPDYFPPFPDSHSYVMTPTFRKPITEYETIREKSSVQRCDLAGALSRFVARSPSCVYNYSLFPDNMDKSRNNTSYQLIGICVNNVPYLQALFPRNQEWDEVDDKATVTELNKDQDQVNSTAMNITNLDGSANADGANTNTADTVDNPHLRAPRIVTMDSF